MIIIIIFDIDTDMPINIYAWFCLSTFIEKDIAK